MSRFIFAALASHILTGVASAQRVPGRDLLEFPLGVLAEAAPLSTQMAGGLWNPATGALGTHHAAFGFAALTSPQDQGVSLNMLGGAYSVRPGIAATFSVASASVADILRTANDPTTLGGEIPYTTTVVSAGAATTRGNTTFGLTARYRWGASDDLRAGALGLDAGAVVDRVAHTPLRLAASTFLFSPTGREATYFVAGDVPLLTFDSTLALRGGYSMSHTEGRGREEYAFATSKYRQLDLSGGLARTFAYGNVSDRWRVGCGLHYAGYTVAIAREDGAAGLGGTFQFLFKRVIP